MLLTCLLPADLRFKCMERPITLVPGPGVVHYDMQEQYVHKNAKKVSWSDPGESNWCTCGW